MRADYDFLCSCQFNFIVVMRADYDFLCSCQFNFIMFVCVNCQHSVVLNNTKTIVHYTSITIIFS